MTDDEKKKILEDVREREWRSLEMAATIEEPNPSVIRATLSNITVIGYMLEDLE